MSVAVDLRYQFDGEALPNQPVTLHLAAVPRVAGANLSVSVQAGRRACRSPPGRSSLQKASGRGRLSAAVLGDARQPRPRRTCACW